MSERWDDTPWVSPLRFFKVTIAVPKMNVPKAAQPEIPTSEVDALITVLEGTIAVFRKYSSSGTDKLKP